MIIPNIWENKKCSFFLRREHRVRSEEPQRRVCNFGTLDADRVQCLTGPCCWRPKRLLQESLNLNKLIMI